MALIFRGFFGFFQVDSIILMDVINQQIYDLIRKVGSLK